MNVMMFRRPGLFLSLLTLLVSTVSTVSAQLSAPKPEAVYGGRIRSMASIPLSADTTQVFITTESANSMFVANMYVPGTGTPVFGPFEVIPALDNAAGYGSNLGKIDAHTASGSVFFLHQGSLMRSHATATSNTVVAGPGINGFTVEGDHLFFLDGIRLHFGLLDALGNFTQAATSPLNVVSLGGQATLHIHPINHKLYFYEGGSIPRLLFLDEAYDAISGTVSFVDVSPASLSATVPWQVFGIGPNGTLFIAGSDVHNKHLAQADGPFDPWTSYNTGSFGAAGGNLAFSGDSTHYYLYFGSQYNDSLGTTGHWHPMGFPGGFETHANDGAVMVDPNNHNIVYMTTDQGIGASVDQGQTLFEINEGVEAVQVKDFDMTPDKQTAWLASKSGIRKVSTYLGTPRWTPAIFPNGDGSPYYSAAMVPGDTNSVYAGNTRVYKSGDGGATWQNQFSATQSPYNFPAFATGSQGASWVSAIEVCPIDTQIVMAGYIIDREEEGGLFWSADGGLNWDQILLEASAIGYDVDVMDIVFNLEGGDTVAYVGVEYDLSSPAGRSVYRLVKNGMNWIVSRDMDTGGTVSGSLIVATIRDLAVSATGDTIFACGTDAGTNHPIAYYKALDSTGLWATFTTSGFPFVAGKQGHAITLGIDTVYVAVDNEVYFHQLGSPGWQLGYTYPVGTEINFLYYDELLVGTSTGLYGHTGISQSTTAISGGLHVDRKLRISPNPAQDFVWVSFEGAKNTEYLLSVYTTTGQEIHRQALRSTETRLDIRRWQRGMYIVRVSDRRRQFSGKLIVN